jgi:hypothetical protein
VGFRRLIDIPRRWVRDYGGSRVAIATAFLYCGWLVAYVLLSPQQGPPLEECSDPMAPGAWCLADDMHSIYLAERYVDLYAFAGRLFELQALPALLILVPLSMLLPRAATAEAQVFESHAIFGGLLILGFVQWWLIGMALKALRVFEVAMASVRDFGRSRLAGILGLVHLAAVGLLLAGAQGDAVGAWFLFDLPAFVLTVLARAPAQNAFPAQENGDWPWTVLLLILGTVQWWLVGVAWAAASRRAARKGALRETA